MPEPIPPPSEADRAIDLRHEYATYLEAPEWARKATEWSLPFIRRCYAAEQRLVEADVEQKRLTGCLEKLDEECFRLRNLIRERDETIARLCGALEPFTVWPLTDVHVMRTITAARVLAEVRAAKEKK